MLLSKLRNIWILENLPLFEYLMHPVAPADVIDHITRGQLYHVLDSVWRTGGDGGHLVMILHNPSVCHGGRPEHWVAHGQHSHYFL